MSHFFDVENIFQYTWVTFGQNLNNYDQIYMSDKHGIRIRMYFKQFNGKWFSIGDVGNRTLVITKTESDWVFVTNSRLTLKGQSFRDVHRFITDENSKINYVKPEYSLFEKHFQNLVQKEFFRAVASC